MDACRSLEVGHWGSGLLGTKVISNSHFPTHSFGLDFGISSSVVQVVMGLEALHNSSSFWVRPQPNVLSSLFFVGLRGFESSVLGLAGIFSGT